MNTQKWLEIISDAETTSEARLEALRELAKQIHAGEITPDASGNWVNNHIQSSKPPLEARILLFLFYGFQTLNCDKEIERDQFIPITYASIDALV